MQMGLPQEIAMTPKRATQYSSGSTNILIESVRENVSSLKDKSKKQLIQSIQHVLDLIGLQVGIESARDFVNIEGIDYSATRKFAKKLKVIPQR